MIVFGLTGSIGMGKTTTADLFRRLGVPVHDSDLEVHRLLGPGGAAVEEIARMFPDSVDTDASGAEFINRSKLGRIIFPDSEKRKRLEAVVHPLVRQAQDAFLAVNAAHGAKAVVLDIPLLFETGAEKRVDIVVCVTAPAFIQRQRVMRRPGMTEEKFRAILASQMPDAEKRKRADFIVQTGLGKIFALQQIRRILREAKKKVKK